MPSERFITMGSNSYVPDLVYAADVVLGKIGYGFVSECISTGTPLVYVPRQHWPEEQYLEVRYDSNRRLWVVMYALMNASDSLMSFHRAEAAM